MNTVHVFPFEEARVDSINYTIVEQGELQSVSLPSLLQLLIPPMYDSQNSVIPLFPSEISAPFKTTPCKCSIAESVLDA